MRKEGGRERITLRCKSIRFPSHVRRNLGESLNPDHSETYEQVKEGEGKDEAKRGRVPREIFA